MVGKSKFDIQILDPSDAYDCEFLRTLTLSFLVFPFGTLMGKPLNLQIKHNSYKNFYFNFIKLKCEEKHKINCQIQHFYKNMSIKWHIL